MFSMHPRLTGAHLKWIALITMFIDHIAAGFFWQVYYLPAAQFGDPRADQLYTLYYAMRLIGRIAFPIYIYLLFEGYRHTSNHRGYISNMAVLALVSEIPFDLALGDGWIDLTKQNVYWSLLLILLLYQILDRLNNQLIWQLFALVGIGLLAEWGQVDYGWKGIFAGFLLYMSPNDRKQQLIALFIGFLFEIHMPTVYLSLIPIALYNGQRGKQAKWFFYLAYPLHLLLIVLARYLALTHW